MWACRGIFTFRRNMQSPFFRVEIYRVTKWFVYIGRLQGRLSPRHTAKEPQWTPVRDRRKMQDTFRYLHRDLQRPIVL
jgi:hypothetical protein